MASSSMLKGLQPCLEQRPPIAFKLPRSADQVREVTENGSPCSNHKNGHNAEESNGGCSFLTQSICSTIQIPPSHGVTPAPTKSSWSWYFSSTSVPRLSQRNLDLCTEILGSETGRGYMVGNDTIALPPPSSASAEQAERKRKAEKLWTSRKVASPGGMPPPLKSITKGRYVGMVRFMEGGRLVLRAATESSFFFINTRTNYSFCDEDDNGAHRCVGHKTKISPRTGPIHPHPEELEEQSEGIGKAEVEGKKNKINRKTAGKREEKKEGRETEEEDMGAHLGIVGKNWRRPMTCQENGVEVYGVTVCHGGRSNCSTNGNFLLNWVTSS